MLAGGAQCSQLLPKLDALRIGTLSRRRHLRLCSLQLGAQCGHLLLELDTLLRVRNDTRHTMYITMYDVEVEEEESISPLRLPPEHRRRYRIL